jgi:hypothetical protein
LPLNRVASNFVFAGALALAAAVTGCSGTSEMFDSKSENRLFAKPMDVFAKPDWSAAATDAKTVSLGPSGPVAPENLVSADGHCAPATVAEAPQPAAATPAAATSNAAVPQSPVVAPVLGGIALGMTECDVVRRAGQPINVSIGAGDKGERKAVLTYVDGSWPGVYNFAAGRLKEISAAPVAPKPVRSPAKKKRGKKTAHQGADVYVR